MDENKQRNGVSFSYKANIILISYKKSRIISKSVSDDDFLHYFYYNNYFYKKVMRSMSRLVWTPEDNILNVYDRALPKNLS